MVVEGNSQVGTAAGPKTKCQQGCLHQLKKDCGGRHRSPTHPPNDQKLHAASIMGGSCSGRTAKEKQNKTTEECWAQGGASQNTGPMEAPDSISP